MQNIPAEDSLRRDVLHSGDIKPSEPFAITRAIRQFPHKWQ